MPVITLNIGSGSDGDGRRRPKTGDFTRNDGYWLERIATDWVKDLGQQVPGCTYRLDKLPDGYGGYEKTRADSKHVDRYIYGHPHGVFRSMVEFYPHFKHLMDHGDASDCKCKLCSGNGKSRKTTGAVALRSRPAAALSKEPPVQPRFFAGATKASAGPGNLLPPHSRIFTPREQISATRSETSKEPPPRRRQVDAEGSPDVIRLLIDKLKSVGTEGSVNEPIVEHMSPDWHTGHVSLMQQLQEYSRLPMYVPRVGELVLFVRDLSAAQTLEWDASFQSWRVVNENHSWAARPSWEVGVVTQMPTEPVTDEDLTKFPSDKHDSVVNAGFRIEPLSRPNSVTKTHHRQHRYVPLHAIRPFALWKDCQHGIPEHEWHPTVWHALTVTSSHSILGRYHFKGTWPEATVFAQGIYIGPELICLDDIVRLYNRSITGQPDTAGLSDILIVTAIRIRLVNLQDASDDDYDEGRPYLTCVHISGHAFTQDPTRSFDGVGRVPIAPESSLLPTGIRKLGTWYHMTDPKKTKTRLEVPYQRVIGRCYESEAIKAWFSPRTNLEETPTSSFQAINMAKQSITLNGAPDIGASLSHGLHGILEARAYSEEHDTRIDKALGKTWFWADTREEQLDLHEINGYFVGVKDDIRSKEQIADWRKALKALDCGPSGVARYYAARKQKEEEKKKEGSRTIAYSSSAMVATAAIAQAEQSTEGDLTMGDEEDVEEEVDEVDESMSDGMEMDYENLNGPQIGRNNGEDNSKGRRHLEDSEDEKDNGNDTSAVFKTRPASTHKQHEIIILDDDD